MINRQKELIFLTSLPRSGSTWSSNAIAKTLRAKLIHEPFNWKKYPERESFHMRYIPTNVEEPELLAILQKSLRPKLPFLDSLRFANYTVIKDVHVCLALEYIEEHLNPLVIIVVRHPCALAASWYKLNLEAGSRIQLLLAQDTLVKKYLQPFARHMESQDDFYFEIGAYWGAAYFVLDQISSKHSSWQWVTHESLCVNSVLSFQKLFTQLGIVLGENEQKQLEKFLYTHDRQRERHEGPYSLARVSSQEPDKWRTQLTPEQISRVLAGAEPFGTLDKFEALCNSW